MGFKQSKLIDQNSKNISANLLFALKETNIWLSSEYLCMICFGILIFPMKCRNCNAKACGPCIESSLETKLFCYCHSIKKDNFIPCIVPTLDNTEYFI